MSSPEGPVQAASETMATKKPPRPKWCFGGGGEAKDELRMVHVNRGHEHHEYMGNKTR